ncbi:uncharacterized protein LY79DRAFT_260094 [Colletotrichum navitas]|uniref:Uncharacterized protein n=1 Tax=Colletotrichum navitas TaxID=681940 RepID=A0AAD8V3D7_9PEZI|nr:uncharacterized protein LY79DRAFT_260094 [Colletotrichum navitas]KAK1585773.1 hypothetical protein LY79DRAFT_260094 [Colletotrichum navitas]
MTRGAERGTRQDKGKGRRDGIPVGEGRTARARSQDRPGQDRTIPRGSSRSPYEEEEDAGRVTGGEVKNKRFVDHTFPSAHTPGHAAQGTWRHGGARTSCHQVRQVRRGREILGKATETERERERVPMCGCECECEWSVDGLGRHKWNRGGGGGERSPNGQISLTRAFNLFATPTPPSQKELTMLARKQEGQIGCKGQEEEPRQVRAYMCARVCVWVGG